MKYALLVVLLFLTGCAPKTQEVEPPHLSVINIVDQNGMTETISTPDRIKQYEGIDFLQCQSYKKVMRIYSRDECGNVNAYITSYHSNGEPRQYLEVVNGRAFGCYKEWHNNGNLKIQATIVNGDADLDVNAQKTWLFDGLCEVWDEQGNKSATLPYSKGQLEGTSLYYHTCGSIWKSICYKQDKREGLQQVFVESGALLSEVYFSCDEPDGTATRYWLSGSIAADECFYKGRLVSGKYFDTCGRLICEVIQGQGKRALFGKECVSSIQNYVGGLPQGKVEVYNSRGKLASYYHMKEGMKNGEEIQLYPGTLEPKLLINWHQGKVQGLVKTWYKNGQLENQREMSDNQKTGLLTAWYQDGTLMMIEEYDHDKLIRGEYYRSGEKRPVTEVSKGSGVATLFDAEGLFLKRVVYLNGLPEP